MSIEAISEPFRIEYDTAAVESENPIIAHALRQIVRQVEERDGFEVVKVVNLLIDAVGSDSYIYVNGFPDEDGTFTEGTIRIGVEGDQIVFQKYLSGTWTTRNSFNMPD